MCRISPCFLQSSLMEIDNHTPKTENYSFQPESWNRCHKKSCLYIIHVTLHCYCWDVSLWWAAEWHTSWKEKVHHLRCSANSWDLLLFYTPFLLKEDPCVESPCLTVTEPLPTSSKDLLSWKLSKKYLWNNPYSVMRSKFVYPLPSSFLLVTFPALMASTWLTLKYSLQLHRKSAGGAFVWT